MRPCRLWDGLSGAEEPAARTSILSLAVRAPSTFELLGPKRYTSEVNYLAAAPRHSANKSYQIRGEHGDATSLPLLFHIPLPCIGL